MRQTLPVSPTLRLLQRDADRVLSLLDGMERMTRPEDEPVGDRLRSIRTMVENVVELFRLGPGNPMPAIPVYVDFGGES